MSPFEFFFSFYGLILGLSMAAIAAGIAAAFEARQTLRVGWLTPLLAAFVALDIASFWETAWTSYRDVPFSYGMLVIGATIALVYYVAASLVFPRDPAGVTSLDEHFWANRRTVLLLTTLANALMLASVTWLVAGTPRGDLLIRNYAVTGAIYLVLIVPAALVRWRWVVATLIGLHIVIYLLVAAITLARPQPADPAPRLSAPAHP